MRIFITYLLCILTIATADVKVERARERPPQATDTNASREAGETAMNETTKAVRLNAGKLDCNGTYRSSTPPTSVHALRVGDIDVVAALGDSLTAGFGALAASIFSVRSNWQGQSFSGGGDDSLRQGVYTFPNILKEFNPNLTGFATGKNNEHPGLNMGASGATVRDMPMQAADLVKRMKDNPNIDIDNDWKVVTIFIGGNNLCNFCDENGTAAAEHTSTLYKSHLTAALDYLRCNSPRTLVNLVEIFDISLLSEVASQNFICNIVLRSFCKCAGVSQSLRSQYQRATKEILNSGRYDQLANFTVVLQPMFRQAELPRSENGRPDRTYLAPDCFHFSAKGHYAAGRALWNNMLEPIDSKSTDWEDLITSTRCPMTDFIPTRENCNIYPTI